VIDRDVCWCMTADASGLMEEFVPSLDQSVQIAVLAFTFSEWGSVFAPLFESSRSSRDDSHHRRHRSATALEDSKSTTRAS
jgi:hypothetical protein